MKGNLLVALTLVLAAGPAAAQEGSSNAIAPRAEEVLRAACQYLAQAPSFSFNAEVWREHVNDSGQKLQFSRVFDMEVKRGNRLHAEIHSSHMQRGYWYDGKTLTILDRERNLYSATPMPSSLDAALDAAHDRFGVDIPLVDLAVSDPYKNAMARVETGRYFGIAPAMGYDCHHLAFTQDNVDWQIWIQNGPRPLIRKFVITHKNEPGTPEFTALIRNWDLTDPISDADFVFAPPRGAMKIEMRSDQASSAPATKPPETLQSPKEK